MTLPPSSTPSPAPKKRASRAKAAPAPIQDPDIRIITESELSEAKIKYHAKLDAAAPAARNGLAVVFQKMTVHHSLLMPSVLAMDWKIWDPRVDTRGGTHIPCPTACTDGRTVWINPIFFTGLSAEQQLYLVLHEIFHPLLNHLGRMVGFDHKLANIATDFEINNLLDEYGKRGSAAGSQIKGIANGVSDANLRESFGGLAAELIAAELLRRQKEDKDKGKGKGQKGDGDKGDSSPSKGQGDGEADDFDPYHDVGQAVSAGEFMTPSDAEEAAALSKKWREVRASTVNAARMAGTTAGGFIERLDDNLKPPVTLDELLERALSEVVVTDCGTRFDRRFYDCHDMVIPDDTKLAAGTVVFIKDTSGSVSRDEAASVMSIVEDSVERLDAKRFVVLDVDTEVAAVEELTPGDRCSREFKGRGGTDLRAGFAWQAKHAEDCKILVCFTDGCTPFPDEVPEYPVVWIHFGPAVAYPFGEVIDITALIARSARR
jgi:predicted metal-dependent peptidase